MRMRLSSSFSRFLSGSSLNRADPMSCYSFGVISSHLMFHRLIMCLQMARFVDAKAGEMSPRLLAGLAGISWVGRPFAGRHDIVESGGGGISLYRNSHGFCRQRVVDLIVRWFVLRRLIAIETEWPSIPTHQIIAVIPGHNRIVT